MSQTKRYFPWNIQKYSILQGGGLHERTDSVVSSQQETKMEGVQHVYNKKDKIDAALVCEDRLREHT